MLKELYLDKLTLEELKQYAYRKVSAKALSMLYAGKDVSHIPEAKKLLDTIFGEMELDFGEKAKQKEISSR